MIAHPDARAARAPVTFPFVMAVLAAVTVFVAFAPSFYLARFTGAPAATPIVRLHALAFTAWIVVFVLQVTLVRARRVALHRRLGVAAALLVPVLLALGASTAIAAARRGHNPGGAPDALGFLAIPLGDLLVFAICVGAAVLLRHRREAHARLMLLATLGAVLPPAIARLPFAQGRPAAIILVTAAFLLAMPVHDRLRSGRIHPVAGWGALLVFLSMPLRMAIAHSDWWHDLARWLVR